MDSDNKFFKEGKIVMGYLYLCIDSNLNISY